MIITKISFGDGTSWDNPWTYEWIFSNFANKNGHIEKSVYYDRAMELYNKCLNNEEYFVLPLLENKLVGFSIVDDENAHIFEYAKGLQDMEYKLYGQAIEHFEKTDYKNSEELKNELLDIVSKFNGTYYYKYHSVLEDGTGNYIYIKNGRVATEIRFKDEKNDPVYYSYDLVNHPLWEEKWYIGSIYFSRPIEVEDLDYSFSENTTDNTYWVGQYGDYDIFEGTYTKISDTYPDEK